MKIQIQYLKILETSTVVFFILTFIKILETFYYLVGLTSVFIINAGILLLIFFAYSIIIHRMVNQKYPKIKGNLFKINIILDILEMNYIIILTISTIFNDLLPITIYFLVITFPVVLIRRWELLSCDPYSKDTSNNENISLLTNASMNTFIGTIIGFILYFPILNNYFLNSVIKNLYVIGLIGLKIIINIYMSISYKKSESNSPFRQQYSIVYGQDFEKNKDKINYNIFLLAFSIAVFMMLFESSNIIIDIIPIWLNGAIDSFILLLGMCIVVLLLMKFKANPQFYCQAYIFKLIGVSLFLISTISISIISRNGDFSNFIVYILYLFKIIYLITFPMMLIPLPLSKIYRSQKLVSYIFLNFWIWTFSIAILLGGMLLLHSWSREYNLYYFGVVIIISLIFGGISSLKKIISRGASI